MRNRSFTLTARHLALILLFFACTRIAAEGQNLLTNGGFEKSLFGMPVMWNSQAYVYTENAVRFFIDEKDPFEGLASFAIANLEPNDSALVQWVKVRPDTFYRLSCRIRVADLETEKFGASVTVLGITRTSNTVSSTGDEWAIAEIYGRTGPDQTEIPVALRLGFYASLARGIAYFDDVRLTEAERILTGEAVDFSSGAVIPVDPADVVSSGKIGSAAIVLAGIGVLVVLLAVSILLMFRVRGGRRRKGAPEMRLARRKRLGLTVSLNKILSDGLVKRMTLKSFDISPGGFFVITEDLSLFRIDEEMQVDLSLRNERLYSCMAKVIRSEELFDARGKIVKSGFGFKFINQRMEDIELLRRTFSV